MMRSRVALTLGVVAALALGGCGGDDDEAAPDGADAPITAGSTLTASVGPGFEISLTGPDGDAVTALAAGDYTIEVDDQSDMHNFHLTGTGVDEDSGVSETGTSTWEVTFEDGSYVFQCDPHASSMNGAFEVSS